MRKTLPTVAMALAVIAALGFGWYERSRAERFAEAEQAQRSKPLPDCSHANFASLVRAVSAVAETKSAVAKPTTPTQEKDNADVNLDDMSPDSQAKLFDFGDKLADASKQTLTELVSKLRLSAEQEKKLRDSVAKMNERAAQSLDRLIALTSQKEPVRPREAIDALADGLNAVRDADDGFRATLDDTQQKQLAADGFDMTSQIDPSILVTRVIAFAVSASTSKDANDSDTAKQQ